MNPLAVFRCFGELLDSFLREAKPPRDANFAADKLFERPHIFQHYRRHRTLLKTPALRSSTSALTVESSLAKRLQFSDDSIGSHNQQRPGAMRDPQLECALRSEYLSDPIPGMCLDHPVAPRPICRISRLHRFCAERRQMQLSPVLLQSSKRRSLDASPGQKPPAWHYVNRRQRAVAVRSRSPFRSVLHRERETTFQQSIFAPG